MKVRMRTRQTVATSVLLLVLLGVAGTVQSLVPQSRVATSPEIGFTSLSPRGAAGGAIVPASCESGYAHLEGICGEFTFTADSYTVAYNTGTTLRWSLSGNAGAIVTYCEAAGGPWGGVKAVPSGAEGTAALTSATTYTLLCHYSYGLMPVRTFDESKSVTINVNPLPPPSAILYPSSYSVAYGARATLFWSSADATSCTAGGPWSNSGTLSGSGLTDPLTSDTTFTFQCTGPGGTSPLQSVTVTVTAPTCANGANNPPTCSQCPNNLAYVSGSCVACGGGGCTGTGGNSGNPFGSLVCNNGTVNPPSCSTFVPTATLSASPTTIDQGQSSTLTWGSTNATACVGTGFTAGGSSGTRSTGTLSTAGIVTYQIVCSGTGGSSPPAFASVEVLSPDATISASPARVTSGSNTTLSWSASGVVSCVVTGPSGTLASGNANASRVFSTGSPRSVAVTGQSTFTITCQTNSTPITRSVTVNLLTDFEEF